MPAGRKLPHASRPDQVAREASRIASLAARDWTVHADAMLPGTLRLGTVTDAVLDALAARFGGGVENRMRALVVTAVAI